MGTMVETALGKPAWNPAAMALIAIAGCLAAAHGLDMGLRYSWDIQWDVIWAIVHRVSPFQINDPALAEKHAEILRSIGPQSWQVSLLQCHPYSPGTLALFWPLGLLDWPQARWAWVALELTASALVLGLARDLWIGEISAARYWTIAGTAMVTTTPWQKSMIAGQTATVSLAFFLLGLWVTKKGRPAAAGMLLALGLLKYSLTLPLGWLFLRGRQWRAIAVAGAVSLALFLWVSLWLGQTPAALFKDWMAVLAGFMDGQGASPDITSWLVDFFGRRTGGAAAFGLAGISFAAILWLDRRYGLDEVTLLAFLAQLTLLFSYHREHDQLVLIFASIVAWRHRNSRTGLMLALLVGWAFWPETWGRLIDLALLGWLVRKRGLEAGRLSQWAIGGWVAMVFCLSLQWVQDPRMYSRRAGFCADFLMIAACLAVLAVRKGGLPSTEPYRPL
jgi:hypothetical protein